MDHFIKSNLAQTWTGVKFFVRILHPRYPFNGLLWVSWSSYIAWVVSKAIRWWNDIKDQYLVGSMYQV